LDEECDQGEDANEETEVGRDKWLCLSKL
jgi:hypothetical protein